MKLLFLTLSRITDINERGIYNDLIRKFRNEGHNVYVISPYERIFKQPTQIIESDGIKLLKIKSLNIQKTNIIEKSIATLFLQYQFLFGIRKHFKQVKFDIVLYSTPPITYSKVISYVKKRDKAKSYLLLKDIFPQNAVDIGLIKQNSIIHRYFKTKEKELYFLSDYIGCMSKANVNYVIKHNPDIDPNKIEVNPNSIEPVENILTNSEIQDIRTRFSVPSGTTLFVYGGNLGLPQGIEFLIEIIEYFKNKPEVFFIVIGSGTMFPKINSWFSKSQPQNAKLLNWLPKKEYDCLIQACDVGMIFLDKRFTIPNYPSRLLSYLENKKPVILATDRNTDIGKIAVENEFGLWVESGDITIMVENIINLFSDKNLRCRMGQRGYEYFLKNYLTLHSYSIIMKHFTNV